MKMFKSIIAIPATIFGAIGLSVLFVALAVKLTAKKLG